MHFDQEKELVLTCDASPWGVGGVLSHRGENGWLAPIAYYSITMNATERRYSQLDKEALAIVKCMKKFYNHLLGRKFEIQTDHKPLLGLWGAEKPITSMVSPRLVRGAVFLSNYDYQLIYVPKEQIENADALSRIPPEESKMNEEHKELLPDVLLLESLPERPINCKLLAKFTKDDSVLGQVYKYTQKSWPNAIASDVRPFHVREDEISIYRDSLLWGIRVIIPERARNSVLKMLHGFHIGIQRMKALARSLVLTSELKNWLATVPNVCRS